jgi:RNA polymerase sigma factor (sigma-70 family)
MIKGEDLKHDICQLITELSRSMPAVPVESVAEPVLTLDEISEKLNVSTKTINRWRSRGLIGLPVLCNGRKQVGFLPSLVEPFIAANQLRVDRGSRFTQMSEEERDDILRRAQRLSRVGGGTLTEVSRRLARRLGRSPETIRYTIKNFDRAHPEQALFPTATGPLDAEAKQVIFNSYRRGIAVDTLAKRFRRTRTSMYRVINEVRARRLLDHPLDCIYHPSFDDPGAAADIMAPMPGADEFEAKRREMKVPKDVPPELASLYETPLLNKEQEQHLFRQMNYLKYRAGKIRGKLDPARARIQDLKHIEDLQNKASKLKDQLVGCNMRLVVSVAKKHAAQTDNFFELLSDGNMSLLRAVEKFDYSRGNKFSTYATWAIMKNYARSIPDEKHRRERYITGQEEIFEFAPDNRTDEQECLASAEQAAHRVNRLLEYLDPRERQIIRMRAGLDSNAKGMTLEEIGQQLGITKERVRQLNVRIMNKLRTIAKDQKVEIP